VVEPFLIHGSGAAPVVPVVMAVPAQDPAPPPGKGPEFGEASPVALVVIVLLAITTALLIRSMTKRIRRLPPSFGPADEKPDGKADAEHGNADAEHGAGDGERGSGDAGSGRA